MIKLSAKIRKETGKKTKALKMSGKIPAILYGHKVDNVLLEVDSKEFQKVFDEIGATSLMDLIVEGEKDLPAGRQEKGRPVLIHEIQKDPLSDSIVHVDFFQASLTEEVEVEVPLVFEGTALAVKDLGGTLVKNISEVSVKALPQNLPHEIKVSIDGLKTLESRILVRDLVLPEGVKMLIKPEEIVVSVAEQEDVEAELETPIEEKIEDVEKIEKEKKEEEIVEDEAPAEKSEAKDKEEKKN